MFVAMSPVGLSYGSVTSEINSEGLEEMFKVTLQASDRKISACVDEGLSRGSSVRRPWSEDPIGASGNLVMLSDRSLLFEWENVSDFLLQN